MFNQLICLNGTAETDSVLWNEAEKINFHHYKFVDYSIKNLFIASFENIEPQYWIVLISILLIY